MRGVRMAWLVMEIRALLRSLTLRMDVSARCFVLRMGIGTRRLMAFRSLGSAMLRTMLRNIAAAHSRMAALSRGMLFPMLLTSAVLLAAVLIPMLAQSSTGL